MAARRIVDRRLLGLCCTQASSNFSGRAHRLSLWPVTYHFKLLFVRWNHSEFFRFLVWSSYRCVLSTGILTLCDDSAVTCCVHLGILVCVSYGIFACSRGV